MPRNDNWNQRQLHFQILFVFDYINLSIDMMKRTMSYWHNPLNFQSAAIPEDPSSWPEGATVRSLFGQDVLWHSVVTTDNNADNNNDNRNDNGNNDDEEEEEKRDKTKNKGRHIPAEQLEAYRQIGDPVVDRIFELRRAEGRPIQAGEDLLERDKDKASGTNTSNHNNRHGDEHSTSERAIEDWIQTHSQIPSWVDLDLLRKGQEVYLAYLPAIGMSLYYRSLVPGFSVPRIAAVLEATGYLAPPSSRQQVWNRLLDTGLMLMTCFASNDVNDILPGGDGWKACLRVRVLHAKVRHGLLRRQGTRAWDTPTLGIPINEEDMCATLLAFAVNPLLGAEMLMGFPVPEDDRNAYLAIWRYLGWLLGVPVNEDYCRSNTPNRPRPLDPCGPGWIAQNPDPLQHSYSVFMSIIFHLMEPDDSSIRIAHHLLRQGRTRDPTAKQKANEESWFYYRALQCRRFVGDPLANALALPLRPTWWRRWCTNFASRLSMLILTVYSWAGLPWSPVRGLVVRWHRHHLVKMSQLFQNEHAKRMQESLSSPQTCPFAMVSPPIH